HAAPRRSRAPHPPPRPHHPPAPPRRALAAPPAEEIGVLFLRSDGGDPQQLRADSGAALIFVARRDGDGRAYRNGREVGLDPGVKESAVQIALAQFGAAGSGDIVLSSLPASAQAAPRQYAPGGAPPPLLFPHVTSPAATR